MMQEMVFKKQDRDNNANSTLTGTPDQQISDKKIEYQEIWTMSPDSFGQLRLDEEMPE
jgi:hypothetical protein